MANILIENGVVLSLNPQRDLFAPGYVLIEGDKIAAVGAGRVRRPKSPRGPNVSWTRRARSSCRA